MLKLTISMICAGLLLSGCADEPVEIPVTEGLLFCDAEEQRRFSQAEIDWRSENAPWNFRRDLKTNTTGARECEWG